MIFYFTGTGNSMQAAKNIAEYNDDSIISIAKEMSGRDRIYEYSLKDNEVLGFVFPVYAWAPPEMVLRFIERIKFNNYKDNYIFAVATCGEDIGNTMKVLDKYLIAKGMKLDSGFSIVMPNNYIIIGDVDSKEVEGEKLLAAENELKNINRVIGERKRGVFQIHKGTLKGLMTTIVNPLFNKHARDTSKFYAKDNCTGCGLCERVCSTCTIKVTERPVWGKECTQCLACLHLCPVKAIEYGKSTLNKGRYNNPNINVNERFIIGDR